mmetsp:Transcript_69001/g.200207  ORF Transcript_69001/g.200207 Transcript_69001/m.200207 type:complete len:224 (-) Transcript_69001:563-1234(-)
MCARAAAPSEAAVFAGAFATTLAADAKSSPKSAPEAPMPLTSALAACGAFIGGSGVPSTSATAARTRCMASLPAAVNGGKVLAAACCSGPPSAAVSSTAGSAPIILGPRRRCCRSRSSLSARSSSSCSARCCSRSSASIRAEVARTPASKSMGVSKFSPLTRGRSSHKAAAAASEMGPPLVVEPFLVREPTSACKYGSSDAQATANCKSRASKDQRPTVTPIR